MKDTDRRLKDAEEALLSERAARLQAEAERDSLRTLFMEAPAAFALLSGPDHRYLLSNRMNQELAGGRPLVGKTVREILPELEAQGVVALVEEVYRTGQPFNARDFPVTLPPTPDRPARTVHLSGVYQPVRDSAGDVIGIMSFAYEVTELVKLRRAAEETEERFRLALAAADLGTWDFDPQTRMLACDDRFRALFGIPPGAEVTAARMMKAVHPDDRARLQSVADRSMDPAGAGAYAIDYRTVGEQDGVERWISVRGRTSFDGAGRPVRFTGAALEITAQVLANEKLQQAQRNAATLADAVPGIIWTAGKDGVTDFYNRRWYEYTGLSAGSIGVDDWKRVVHSEDLPNIQQHWTTSFASGEAFQMEVRLLRHADRTYRWHLAQTIPVKDEKGAVVKWVGSSTDIDDQKRVEDITRFLGDASALLAESLDSETTLQNLAQLVVPRLADWCSIYLVDRDDPTIFKTFLAHRDPTKVRWARELREKYPPDVNATSGAFHVIRTGKPELLPEITDAILQAAVNDPEQLAILRALEIQSVMTVPITARGRTFGAISFVAAESGRRYGAGDVVIAQTLAERTAHAVDNARLYAEAQEAVRVRDDFMSIASHELRTPLTPLQLHLQSLQSQPSGTLPDKVVKKLDVMGRQVDRLERLVRSLVDISRLTGRRFDVECEDVDLSEVVRDVAERFGVELERANCPLTLKVPGPVVGLWDRLQIEQILSNLLGNAVKFGAGTPVEVVVEGEGGVARLVVRDRGIGIDAKDQGRIFERFERAVSSRSYGGFGLGLWIVGQLVHALGGTVSVESEVGVGSTFIVLLPQARGMDAAHRPEMRAH